MNNCDNISKRKVIAVKLHLKYSHRLCILFVPYSLVPTVWITYVPFSLMSPPLLMAVFQQSPQYYIIVLLYSTKAHSSLISPAVSVFPIRAMLGYRMYLHFHSQHFQSQVTKLLRG